MKKSRVLLSLFTVFTLIVVMVACSSSVSASDTYVTIDINPSVELIVNHKEIVTHAHALNDDGEVLLSAVDVVGLSVDDAMDLIINTAIELGYIDVDSEEIVVSVATPMENDQSYKIKNRVKEAINDAFLNRGLMGKARQKAFSDAFVLEAESYGVTPEVLSLAYRVTYVDDTLSIEDAVLLSADDLTDILKNAFDEAKEIAQIYKEAFIIDRDEIKAKYCDDILELENQIDEKQEAIDLSDEDTSQLEAELQLLQDQLEQLVNQKNAELQALRDEYLALTLEMRETYQQIKEQRISEYSEKVQNWLNRRSQIRQTLKDAIKQYQNEEQSSEDE